MTAKQGGPQVRDERILLPLPVNFPELVGELGKGVMVDVKVSWPCNADQGGPGGRGSFGGGLPQLQEEDERSEVVQRTTSGWSPRSHVSAHPAWR